MGQLVQYRDGGNVTGVASGGLKSADTAFAENYIGVAVRDDVFGGHQEFLYRAAQAALEEHRAPAFAEGLEQNEILHVASAYLHHVSVLSDQIDIAVTHDLSNDGQPSFFAGFLQQLQTLFFHALKVIGGGSWLEGPPPMLLAPRFSAPPCT